jgi:hypothetical protein
MREPANDSGMGVPPVQSAPDVDWENLRPMLDDAMHELKETDREAILLRYFENQPFIQVGAKLGLNENAARMRIERALEKLRHIFTKRGVTTATALASVISANAIQIAPVNLAVTLTTASIATAGTGTFTLLKIMTATKFKFAISALVVAGATTAFVIQNQAQEKLRAKNESLTQQIARLQTDNENFSNQLANVVDSKKLSDDQFNELLKLRGEVGVLRRQVGEIGKLREENQQLHAQATNKTQGFQLSEKDYFRLQGMKNVDGAKEIGLGMLLYANDHNGLFPTNLIDQLVGAELTTNNIEDINKFELLNADVPNAHDKYPKMTVLREQVPRKYPKGAWERIYGLADGSVQTAYSDDGNFDAWEKANTSPPPNPNQ